MITTSGKQVLLSGEHFADAITEEGAERIAEALGERAAIVAWLRTLDHVCADVIADQVERGDYGTRSLHRG